jgi:DNA replication factor GINS
MYNELHEIWKQELENRDLGRLTLDFYFRIADYLRRIREEGRMLDKRTVKARLLEKEVQNVKRMVCELMRTRYKKLVKMVAKGEKVPTDSLTAEEMKFYTRISAIEEAHRDFSENLLRGYLPKESVDQEHKIAVVRFLKVVPAIIGVDIKTYGPFKTEDLATLPAENAKILAKQGFVEKMEI